MPTELVQSLVNALLLLVVAFVGGTLGLRRFEALERSVAGARAEARSDTSDLRTELKAELSELRAEVKGEIGELRAEVKGEFTELRVELNQVRSEMSQLRSDLTGVALAVGARPGGASEGLAG
jgi:F0F1-type ATP synthase membrane subunit b/b'